MRIIDNKWMVVSISTEPEFKASTPRLLFEGLYINVGGVSEVVNLRLESIDPAHYGTKVGVMIRNTLEPASPNASVVVTALGDITFQYRTMELEAAHSTDDTINRVGFPHWVRLTREASQFTAQHSSDGVNWQTVQDKSSEQASSIEISMDERVHMGLAITSGSPARRAQAHMASVIVTGLVNPGGQFAQVNDIGCLADSMDCVK